MPSSRPGRRSRPRGPAGSGARPQKAQIARAVHAELWPRIAQRKVEPIIHTTFALEDAEAVQDLLAGDTVIGKLVLAVDRALCAAGP